MRWVAQPLVKPLHMTRQEGGRECWTRSWFPLQTPSGTAAAPWQSLWFCWFCDSPAFALQASAQLCQSQRPSRARDELMINLTATALQHEYGAALNPCLVNVQGMVLTLQSYWCFSVFACNKTSREHCTAAQNICLLMFSSRPSLSPHFVWNKPFVWLWC